MRRTLSAFAALITVVLASAVVLTMRGNAPATTAYAFDPPATGFYIALDCDPYSPGIQDSCTYPWNMPAYIDVAVVLGNVDQAAVSVAAFNFEVTANLGAWLSPLPATSDPLNSNPDFNEAAFHPGFDCGLPPPNPDADPGPATVSRLVCFMASDLGDATVAPEGTIKLGTVRYYWSSGTPFESERTLALQNVNAFAESEFDYPEIGSCNPVNEVSFPCSGATLYFTGHVFPTNTWTPTATVPPTATPTPTPVPDADGDGVPDMSDNCPSTPNPGQEQGDSDITILSPDKPYNDHTWPNSDATGNACDTDGDMDSDGRSDADEIAGAGGCAPTNPLLRDTDGDRMLDGAECALVTDPNAVNAAPAACAAPGDADVDGVLDAREFCYYGTSYASTNTDGDTCSDVKEVASINADTTVSAIDLSQVAQAFGPYTVPNAPFRLNFDVTKDGNINAIDLSQVAQRFGPC